MELPTKPSKKLTSFQGQTKIYKKIQQRKGISKKRLPDVTAKARSLKLWPGMGAFLSRGEVFRRGGAFLQGGTGLQNRLGKDRARHPPSQRKGGVQRTFGRVAPPPQEKKKKKEGVERHGEGGRASAEDLPLKGRGLSLSPPSYLRANC